MMKKSIKIDGMHCEHCSGRVAKALENLGLSVKVELSSGMAYIEGEIPDDTILTDTICDLGFEVVEIS